MSRKLDVNLVYLESDKSNIINSLIGESKLTQNIIHYTYSLHPQSYPPIVHNPIQIDLEDFTTLFSKIILDWTEKLLGKSRYKELRPIKAQVYSNIISRLVFSLQILKEVDFVELYNVNKNIIKSIGMKLSQHSLLRLAELEYTKVKISHQINKILPIEYVNILFILT